MSEAIKASSRVSLREVVEIVQHTIALLAALGSIWCVQRVLEVLLGTDAKFYDRIPVRYVIDTGHLAVLSRFAWKLIARIWRREK